MLNTPTHLVFVDVERQKNKNGLSSSLLSTLVLIFLSFMVIVFLAKNNFPFNHITYKTINGNQIFIRFKVKDFLFSWRKFPGKKNFHENLWIIKKKIILTIFMFFCCCFRKDFLHRTSTIIINSRWYLLVVNSLIINNNQYCSTTGHCILLLTFISLCINNFFCCWKNWRFK